MRLGHMTQLKPLRDGSFAMADGSSSAAEESPRVATAMLIESNFAIDATNKRACAPSVSAATRAEESWAAGAARHLYECLNAL
jgi:hypothetical protein